MTGAEGTNYYLERKERYWRQLARMIKSSDKILPRYLDPSRAAGVADETYDEFGRTLSSLPPIGGDGNMLAFTFVTGAAALAYIRVLERRELPVDTIGEILNEVYGDVFAGLPGIVKWWLRTYEFSRRHQKAMRACAERSQRREYPDDWVMVYVEGDGEAYDWGVDYTECAVLKFFQKMGAEAYMPYVCVVDFAMSQGLRTGLRRSKTLYYGGDCCDFRYKKNALGLAPLPLEQLPEYRARAEGTLDL